VSSLADIADAARKLRPPALIVIGATAALASERPLGALLEGQTG
jgi:siroheme synthase